MLNKITYTIDIKYARIGSSFQLTTENTEVNNHEDRNMKCSDNFLYLRYSTVALQLYTYLT